MNKLFRFDAINKLKQNARQLKSEASVLLLAYKDKRTPIAAKLLIGFTVGYLLSPIDLIPDFIPILGLLDDIILVPILISASVKLIPEIVLREARQVIKDKQDVGKRNNWYFAIIIIVIWSLVLYFLYSHLRFPKK